MNKNPESFEAAMRRLEEIANLLEEGDAELAKSLELYEEGAGLSAWCAKELENARQKVTRLSEAGQKQDD